jgi:mannosyltransferase
MLRPAGLVLVRRLVSNLLQAPMCAIIAPILSEEKRHGVKNRSSLAAVLILSLITLLALGLRLYRLDAQSLWYDEGFSVYLARMDLAEITVRTATDIQPPLYYYLLHGWIALFGQGERTLRALSVLFGVLTVPLIYAVAWQLFRSRGAGLLAAFLVAVSPPHLWYGQELRMYTLLTFLCLLSSYFLLLAMDRVRKMPDAPPAGFGSLPSGTSLLPEIGLWLAFALTSIAAVYTHYFAFLVLAFQGLYVLFAWLVWDFCPRRLLWGGLASGVFIMLAYLPWLPSLITRYGADVSYLPGQLKLGEILVDIAIFFVGGESVSESVGLALVAIYAVVLVFCLLALLRPPAIRETRSPDSVMPRLSISFLLLYLLLPPILILIISYSAPKFNARYVMLSHPALLLLLAGGLLALWRRRSGILGNVLRGASAGLAVLFLVGASAYADYNAYNRPDFARADFRGVARYLGQKIAADETVILCSGHMYPVFDLYAPGIERHLLPDVPTLDTTQTLDYGIADDLNRWLDGKGGVWLVLWQDEVVDPVGYLTTMLDRAGEEQAVDRSFSQIRLRHYWLPAGTVFSDEPDIDHPVNFNFGDRLRLLGYNQSGDRQVTFFWEALRPLDEDYYVSLILRDTAGQAWGRWDGRPAAYLYPTDRWRVGQIVFGRYDLSPRDGTPPGDYGLDLGVYTQADPVGLDVLDQAGAPQGKRAVPGAVRLSVAAVTPERVEIAHPLQADMGHGLRLLGWDLDRLEAQPGDRLHLTLAWSVISRPEGDYRLRLFVTDAAARTLDAGAFPLTNAWHPTSIWLPGQAWLGQSTFRLPIQAQSGEARLSVQLLGANGGALGPVADLTTLEVLPTSRVFAPPQPQAPRQTNFDDRIALLGADLDPDPVAPGGALQVTLYWQALVEMDIPYTVFVHLLGPDGKVVAGDDGQPLNGERPTTGWVPGEYITDAHDVAIPADLPPGSYIVEVGLYDAGAPNYPRLMILDEEGRGEIDRVIFGPVRVR